MFPEISTVNATNAAALDAMGERMILSTQNKDVLDLNELAIDQFPGEARTYYSVGEAVQENPQGGEHLYHSLLGGQEHARYREPD